MHLRRPIIVLALLLLGLLITPPADASRTIKLRVNAGHVKTGTEKQTCFPIVFPSNKAVDVDHVQIFVHGGSHHVHLYRPVSGEVPMFPNPDKTYSPYSRKNRKPRECAFAIDFTHWELVAASQTSNLNWPLHPNVGIHFEPRQVLMIQTHFVNTGFGGVGLDTKGKARAKMVLYPMAPSTVTAHGGALFGQDRTVNVPPGPPCTTNADCSGGNTCSSAGHCTIIGTSLCHMTGNASDNQEKTVMALTGHYHFRGIRYRIWRTLADGTRGELVYLQEGYADPKFQQYSTDASVAPIDGGKLLLKPGEGIEWECTWQNDSTQTFLFGPNTEINEHCNLFGFYYPTDTPLESMDCVHMLDGSEVRTIRK